MDQHRDADDWNARAIPTIPGQRHPHPADQWDTARAARIPRQDNGPDAN
ncbi:hypothetical protein ACWC9H_27280 [Streptomyces sp. NPDC001251]